MTMLFLCMVGLCTGAFFEVFMVGDGKTQLMSLLSTFLGNGINHSFYDIFLSSLKPLLLLWLFFFFCPLLPPLALLGPVICVTKSFTLGFCATMIVEVFGIKGSWYIFTSIMPQGIMQLPVICFLTALSSGFASLMVNVYTKGRGRKAYKNALHINARHYVTCNLSCLAILIIFCLVEAFLKLFLL